MDPAKKNNLCAGQLSHVAALRAGHERAALSQEELCENVLRATEAIPGWCYRILTAYERPGQLRDVEAGIKEQNRDSLRNLVLQGVARGRGRDPAARSQFLHATTRLRKATCLFFGRRRLSQPCLVR